MADRFVLTLINKKIMKPEYFMKKENGVANWSLPLCEVVS